MVEDDDVDGFGASCSNRTALLNRSGCSFSAVSDHLLPMWMSLILFSSCWLSSSPDATACRSAICSFLGSTGTSPAPHSARPLFLSFTCSTSATLCLCAFILVSPVKVLSIILPDSFSTFITVWFHRSSMRCQHCTAKTSSLTMSLDVNT